MYPLPLHMNSPPLSAYAICHSVHVQSGKFVKIDESTLTHNHPKSIVYNSLFLFTLFRQMFNGMYPFKWILSIFTVKHPLYPPPFISPHAIPATSASVPALTPQLLIFLLSP